MLRYGVIGIKGVGQYHIKWAKNHPDVRLTALVDSDADYVQRAAGEYNVRAYTDYRAMLADDIVDAVSIALPHHLLGTVGLACLQRGLHTLVEKPFALTASLAAAMVKEAQTRNLQIGVMYQYRSYATPQMLKRIIMEGSIGRVRQVLWTWQSFRPEQYYRQSAWRGTWEGAGGGLMMNQISHDIDLLCWLFGKPVAVTAMLGNQLHDTPLEDALGAIIKFENDVLVTLQASINQPHIGDIRQIIGDRGMIILPSAQSLAHNPNDRLKIGLYDRPITESVSAVSDDHHQPHITWRSIQTRPIGQRLAQRAGRFFSSQKPVVPSSGHGAVLYQFVDAVLNGSKPMVSGEDALHALECINALVMAALTGETVRLPLDYHAYDALFSQLIDGKQQIPRWR